MNLRTKLSGMRWPALAFYKAEDLRPAALP
jgi:hypothetical protein